MFWLNSLTFLCYLIVILLGLILILDASLNDRVREAIGGTMITIIGIITVILRFSL